MRRLPLLAPTATPDVADAEARSPSYVRLGLDVRLRDGTTQVRDDASDHDSNQGRLDAGTRPLVAVGR